MNGWALGKADLGLNLGLQLNASVSLGKHFSFLSLHFLTHVGLVLHILTEHNLGVDLDSED